MTLTLEIEEKHAKLLRRIAELAQLPVENVAAVLLTHQLVFQAQEKDLISRRPSWR